MPEGADFYEPYGDDPYRQESIGPLLPPEDRLWRHPSELFSAPDPAAAPRRQRRQATRAGALSAGFAGAVLATGLVLVGSHVAVSLNWVGKAPAATAASFVTTTSVLRSLMPFKDSTANTATIVSGELTTMASRIGEATVLVTAQTGATTRRGAGLVIASQCLVLTSYGLVDGAQSLSITLPGGRKASARLLGTDASTGVAVLRCPATALKTIASGTNATVNENELVALVTFTSAGTIQLDFGLVREPETELDLGNAQLLDEIETDIPSPSQGSALLGHDGAIVGLVVATSGGTAVATPSWLAMAAADQIVRSGKVETGVLGITGTASAGSKPGVKVVSVAPGSAAAKAGIKAGDVIQSIDGGATRTIPALQAELHCLRPGTPVEINVQRQGRSFEANAVLRGGQRAA